MIRSPPKLSMVAKKPCIRFSDDWICQDGWIQCYGWNIAMSSLIISSSKLSNVTLLHHWGQGDNELYHLLLKIPPIRPFQTKEHSCKKRKKMYWHRQKILEPSWKIAQTCLRRLRVFPTMAWCSISDGIFFSSLDQIFSFSNYFPPFPSPFFFSPQEKDIFFFHFSSPSEKELFSPNIV